MFCLGLQQQTGCHHISQLLEMDILCDIYHQKYVK